jgi:hypothetical protein
MNKKLVIKVFLIFILSYGCVVPYTPGISERGEMIVIQGLITDQSGINTIKLSKSNPLWSKETIKFFTGSKVWISDNEGHCDTLKETSSEGIYVTDPAKFRGTVGKTYILHVKTNRYFGRQTYESLPMKMNPVPPVDSIYYVKEYFDLGYKKVEGCRIFLSAHDPDNLCRFYRWNFTETWEFHIPFDVKNKICWITNDSKEIFIKNAAILGENRFTGFPLITIGNPIDKLSVKYSLLVNQYSINEDEYIYWERFRNMTKQAGGLYDIIPAPVPNNIFCVENPSEKTLGYFSVSAVSYKRIFIKDNFDALNYMYQKCLGNVVISTKPDTIPGLGQSIWLVEDNRNKVPPANIVTFDRGCVDCTTRGTTVRPSFWDDDIK